MPPRVRSSETLPNTTCSLSTADSLSAFSPRGPLYMRSRWGSLCWTSLRGAEWQSDCLTSFCLKRSAQCRAIAAPVRARFPAFLAISASQTPSAAPQPQKKMSYLNSINKAKKYSTSPHKTLEKCGGIDLMLGSPRRGNASEPWYSMLTPAQVKTVEGREYLAFEKGLKMPGEEGANLQKRPFLAHRRELYGLGRLVQDVRRPRQVAPDRQPRHAEQLEAG